MENRKKMIMSNVGLVYALADSYQLHPSLYDDLVQEGMIGLINAVDKFDPSKGIKLTTYATFYIKGCISSFLMKRRFIMKMPRSNGKVRILYNINNYPKKGQSFSPDELNSMSEKLQVKVEDIKEIESLMYMEEENNVEFDPDDDDFLQSDSVITAILDDERYDIIKQAIETLTPIQQQIINLTYLSKKIWTYGEIADIMGVSPCRIGQICNDALRKIKKRVGIQYEIQN